MIITHSEILGNPWSGKILGGARVRNTKSSDFNSRLTNKLAVYFTKLSELSKHWVSVFIYMVKTLY